MTRCLMRWVLGSVLSFTGGWSDVCAQEGITKEGDTTVFRTGTPAPLLTFSLPLRLPEFARQPLLEFEFGFATAEIDIPDSFFDSFSVTLQPADISKTALLFTADTTGLVRAPTNPGGLVLNADEINLQPIVFPDLSPTFDFHSAFTLSYTLPSELADGPATLYFDFLDNQDSLASLAFVRNVQINALPPTDLPQNLRVWAARRVDGPYAAQASVELDLADQVVRFVPENAQNFFRLQSEVRARILRVEADSADWILTYVFDPELLVLESADWAAGAFTPETTAQIDVTAQTIRLPVPDRTTRFYRIRSEAATTLTAIRLAEGSLILEYALPRLPVSLWLSEAVTGPYLLEHAARQDLLTRTLRLARGGSLRFFQITADRPLRIHNLTRQHGQVTLKFEQP